MIHSDVFRSPQIIDFPKRPTKSFQLVTLCWNNWKKSVCWNNDHKSKIKCFLKWDSIILYLLVLFYSIKFWALSIIQLMVRKWIFINRLIWTSGWDHKVGVQIFFQGANFWGSKDPPLCVEKSNLVQV
jgi:hypothetical protein